MDHKFSIYGQRTLKNRIVAFIVGSPLVIAVPLLIYAMLSESTENLEERCTRTILEELFLIIFVFGSVSMIWAFVKTDKVDRTIDFLYSKLGMTFAFLLGIPLIFECVNYWMSQY